MHGMATKRAQIANTILDQIQAHPWNPSVMHYLGAKHLFSMPERSLIDPDHGFILGGLTFQIRSKPGSADRLRFIIELTSRDDYSVQLSRREPDQVEGFVWIPLVTHERIYYDMLGDTLLGMACPFIDEQED